MSGRRGFILFPKGGEGRSWRRVVAELCEVLAFFEATSKPHFAGVLSSTEKKAGKVLDLHDFSRDCLSWRSVGAWPIVGSVRKSFAEVVRSESIRPDKLWVLLAELCDLDLLPTLKSEDEVLRSAVNCFVLEKLLLGPMVREQMLCLLGKKDLEHGLSD
jgi:hypothetical protein